MPAGKTRPVFAQFGPWTFLGDIHLPAQVWIRQDIAETDGASTDGPVSLWQTNQGKMQASSLGLVTYTQSQHKPIAVMVTPFNLQPVSQWLSVAQECVRTFEDAGVKPNIWIVYEYNTITPALPESIDGRPADTTTGMAYRLIQHLNDPGHRAKLTVSTVSHASKTEMRATVTVSNRSPWLDLCPLAFARMRGPGSADWSLHFYVQGKDVTQ